MSSSLFCSLERTGKDNSSKCRSLQRRRPGGKHLLNGSEDGTLHESDGDPTPNEPPVAPVGRPWTQEVQQPAGEDREQDDHLPTGVASEDAARDLRHYVAVVERGENCAALHHVPVEVALLELLEVKSLVRNVWRMLTWSSTWLAALLFLIIQTTVKFVLERVIYTSTIPNMDTNANSNRCETNGMPEPTNATSFRWPQKGSTAKSNTYAVSLQRPFGEKLTLAKREPLDACENKLKRKRFTAAVGVKTICNS